MKRLLITGATGLIGSPLLEILSHDGREIHAVGRETAPPQAIPAGVHWHQEDLLQGDHGASLIARIRPKGLLHLAWTATPGTTQDAIHESWHRCSRLLLEKFYQEGGARSLVAGTCFEYQWSEHPCAEETTPLAPTTRYGQAKRALATFLESLPLAPGQSWVWPRIFFVHGPREHPDRLVASIIDHLRRGEQAPCTHGRQIRDYLPAREVADGLASLFSSPLTGPCNIASGEPHSIAEIARTVADLLDLPDLLALGARPAPPHEPPVILADTTRQREELGWIPRSSLREGLRETIAARPHP